MTLDCGHEDDGRVWGVATPASGYETHCDACMRERCNAVPRTAEEAWSVTLLKNRQGEPAC